MMQEDAVDKSVDSAGQDSAQAVDEAARLAAQKQRSVWLALALFGFVLLVGITSAFQLKENIQRTSNANVERPLAE